jgi:hypothetical protein
MFEDRTEAGRVLADKLAAYTGRADVVVLALPRGGVPVGFEVARSLGVPLDVCSVRKLGVPGHEELAMGAIAGHGTRLRRRPLPGRDLPEQPRHLLRALLALSAHRPSRGTIATWRLPVGGALGSGLSRPRPGQSGCRHGSAAGTPAPPRQQSHPGRVATRGDRADAPARLARAVPATQTQDFAGHVRLPAGAERVATGRPSAPVRPT